MASRSSKETGRAAASKTGKGTGRAAAKMPEVELAQTTRLGQIMALPVEVIRLHLQQRHLSVTGNKREAAGRLIDALQHRSIDNSDSKCGESEREADSIGRGRSRRTADSSDQHRAESNSRTDSETDPPPPLRASQIHTTGAVGGS